MEEHAIAEITRDCLKWSLILSSSNAMVQILKNKVNKIIKKTPKDKDEPLTAIHDIGHLRSSRMILKKSP